MRRDYKADVAYMEALNQTHPILVTLRDTIHAAADRASGDRQASLRANAYAVDGQIRFGIADATPEQALDFLRQLGLLEREPAA
jgi:hypothetical protein